MLSNVLLHDFRNFRRLDIRLSDSVNIFLGDNAQGKSNILESLTFAALASARSKNVADLINWSSQAAFISIAFSQNGVSHSLAAKLCRPRFKSFFLDSAPCNIRQAFNAFDAVFFAPSDLFLFNSAPAARRRFLNLFVAQWNPIYFADLQAFNRLIEQRNCLLKSIRAGLAKPGDLNLWNEGLAQAAAKITSKRLAALDNLSLCLNESHRHISSGAENLAIEYRFHNLREIPQNLSADILQRCYLQNFASNAAADIRRGATSFGPHLDDLAFFINGNELRLCASQGQIRTAALALKLAELQLLQNKTGEYPLLLLDDVLSELDSNRRHKLLNFLLTRNIQTLITATDLDAFPVNFPAKIFHIANGTLVRSEYF